MLIKTKNFHLEFGSRGKPIELAAVAAKDPVENRTPQPVSIKMPAKDYTWAPLRTVMLPTPTQLRYALLAVETDPRPMMDILRKLAVTDMHLLGVLGTRSDAISGYDYCIEPGQGMEEDKTELQRCDEIMNRLKKSNFDKALANLVNGITFGHSVTVPKWMINERNQYYSEFETIDFIHFAPKNNKLFMIVDKDNKDFMVTIGDNKRGILADTWVNSLSGNPLVSNQLLWLDLDYENLLVMQNNPFEGLLNNYIGGFMRPALYLTLLKHFNILDWAKFNELFGMPLRVGKFDPLVTSPDGINTLKTAVKNLGADASAVIDNTTMIEFLKGEGGGGTNVRGNTYESFASYVENKQSILILGQTLTTELNSKAGSRAAAQIHNLVRMDKLWSDMMKCTKSSQKIVQKDYFYNYGPPPNGVYPQFRFDTDEYKDLESMATVVGDLSNAGLKISKTWAYDYFEIEEPKTKDDEFGGKGGLLGIGG
jgi:phage gp29-like protein